MMEEWFKLGATVGIPLVTFVAGYVRLQAKVESLEKQFEDQGRIGKLEKYASMHFDSIGGIKETNIRLSEKFESMAKSFDELHDKIDHHIDEDAKTAGLIQQILEAVKKGK